MRFPFSDYVGLLKQFLDNRQAIVEGLERRLFSVQGRVQAQDGDLESIAELFRAAFFESPAISQGFSHLDGKLDAAHRADGFEPARQDGYSRALDPVELMLRACLHWDGTRWPGVNGRIVFAQSLYTVFIFRQLEQLSLRSWDPSTSLRATASNEDAAERVQHIQHLLDQLNAGARPGRELRLMRDARWLIQTAQGPLTRHVRPYFITAANISRSFDDTARLEIHRAGAVLAGGHLRSQLRHLSRRTGWTFDDPQLVALTRSSNSMDLALLVHDLVPLLDAYSAACARQDNDARLALADAILQGLSADPELLLTRVDLLGPSTMIEDVFLERSDANAPAYTSMGETHREYLRRYLDLIGRAAESLQQDSREFDAAHTTYSPLGIVYGFCSDLFSNMVLNTLRTPSAPDLTIEDMFNSRERLEEKRAQAGEWERLPKREGEPNPFEHSTEWAIQMYTRLAGALEARATRPTEPNASSVRRSCLYIVSRGMPSDSPADGLSIEAQSAKTGVLPPGIVSAQEHCLTSDVTRARMTGATALPADRLLADRAEGRLLACVYSEGAWFGVSKVPLTLFISQGKDALITDVPSRVIDVLRSVCPELLIVVSSRKY